MEGKSETVKFRIIDLLDAEVRDLSITGWKGRQGKSSSPEHSTDSNREASEEIRDESSLSPVASASASYLPPKLERSECTETPISSAPETPESSSDHDQGSRVTPTKGSGSGSPTPTETSPSLISNTSRSFYPFFQSCYPFGHGQSNGSAEEHHLSRIFGIDPTQAHAPFPGGTNPFMNMNLEGISMSPSTHYGPPFPLTPEQWDNLRAGSFRPCHPHHPLSLDYYLGHRTDSASGASGLVHPGYQDPRLFPFHPYPASTLLARIASGAEYMTPRSLHPILHQETRRKGGQIRFSNSQTMQLEKAFKEHKYQNAHERRKLATRLGLSDRQVKTWFQNRRAKWRKCGVKEEPENMNLPTNSYGELRMALERPPTFDVDTKLN